MKVKIWPDFGKEVGQGGIKRVAEAQHKWLPHYGVEIVDRIEDADVVNVHADSIKTDKPIAASSHGLYWAGYDWQNWCYEANAKLIRVMKKAQATSVPSKFVHRAFARGMLLDPFILYHGVDVEEWEPANNHGYVFWGKTRVDPICDPEPVNILAKSCPEVGFLTTFGNRDLNNVTLTGRVTYDRSREFIRHAGVYLATVLETGGITVLEAAASGVPSIGFNDGANSELIIHKETGYLVERGDYAGLREGLYFCLQNRKLLGEAARQHVIENFQWKDRIADYIPFYERALERSEHYGPTVSVIITAYNLERYLSDCLDSILEQSFTDWECIIVDDCSPDACGAIADQYAAKDSRFKVIHNHQNQYLAGARNVGIQAATGKYVLPLDADDMAGEDALGILSRALDNDLDLDIVTGKFELIETNGRHWVSPWPPTNPNYTEQIKQRNQLPYASMYRKWVWERTGGYKRRWKSAEDAAFWTTAMSFGAVPAHVTDVPTLVYNNRPNSMSHSIATPNWTDWAIWSRYPEFTPFGASGLPKDKTAWPVLMYGPVEVSVVIPVGPGHEHYIVDAVESCQNQTNQRVEIIVVNDTGSVWFDASGNPLTPYTMGMPYVEWVDSDENIGVAAARNKGIAKATAPYILFLDSDDFLQPLAIDVMLKVIREHGGFVYGDWLDQYGEIKEAQDFNTRKLLQKMLCSVVIMVSKTDLVKVGGFDEKAPGWEDYDLLLSLVERDVCGIRVAYPTFTYRYTSGLRREDNHLQQKELLNWIRTKHAKLYKECGQ